MAQYLPPLHFNNVFNAAAYNFQNGHLSYGYAENRYMRKVGSDTVSGIISFTNRLNISGTLNVTGTVTGLTKAMVGLDQVDNTSDLNKPISTATQTALTALGNRCVTLEGKTTNQSYDLASSTTTFSNAVVFSGTVSGIAKAMVGLGNVDNTSDLNKPTSTLTQTALDLKAPLANPTFTGTVTGITKTMVELGNVDNTSDINKPISTATTTALGLKAPLANPIFTGTVTGITKAMVGLSNVDNTADVDKPISTATTTALD